jgi:two-component system chemotaxis response regulator CheV
MPPSENPSQDKFIIAEFNQNKYAFHVHNVQRIHRLSWTQIEKPADVNLNEQNCVTGLVRFEERMILLLDFERIILEISPDPVDLNKSIQEFGSKPKSERKIIVAEDSPMLRKVLQEYLPKVGYPNLTFFQNGQEAWDYLQDVASKQGDNYRKDVDVLITDIEMPQMDGHFLTKNVKSHPVLSDLPVIIFSSLITDDLRHKGDSVGADYQISKPQHPELAKILDGLTGEECVCH